MGDTVCFHIKIHYLLQFYVIWIRRLINFAIDLIDYIMLLYLQGVILNMLFGQSSIPKINHLSHCYKIPFINKGTDFVDLLSTFRDKSVQSAVPNYFKNCEVPTKYTKCFWSFSAKIHGIKKNGNCKRKSRVQKLANCTLGELAGTLDVHDRNSMLSY